MHPITGFLYAAPAPLGSWEESSKGYSDPSTRSNTRDRGI